MDNGCRLLLWEVKRVIGWANPIKCRSSRWMIKQAEGCSGQSTNNQPFKWLLWKWSIWMHQHNCMNKMPGVRVDFYKCVNAFMVHVGVYIIQKKTYKKLLFHSSHTSWIILPHTVEQAEYIQQREGRLLVWSHLHSSALLWQLWNPLIGCLNERLKSIWNK